LLLSVPQNLNPTSPPLISIRFYSILSRQLQGSGGGLKFGLLTGISGEHMNLRGNL